MQFVCIKRNFHLFYYKKTTMPEIPNQYNADIRSGFLHKDSKNFIGHDVLFYAHNDEVD